jgi:hypothetical protein
MRSTLSLNSRNRVVELELELELEFPRFRGHPFTEVERCSDATKKEPVPGGFPGANRRVA